MSKVNKENLLTISNSKLLAVARRDEETKRIVLYTVEEVTLEVLEKMLKHLVREETDETSETIN